MKKLPVIPEPQLESLAKVLGECGSGTDITRVLADRGLQDSSGESTKWRRLYWIFLHEQRKQGCANPVLAFIAAFLSPARFVDKKDAFEANRQDLNRVLAFSGLEYQANGQFKTIAKATTIDEAERRLATIRSKFRDRSLHPEVVKYCRVELLQDNYFHAVFEATKGLAQRIRELAGVDGDGAALVDRAFAVEKPLLAFNSLNTETEKSEHKGFAMLLKGCFGAIRNPRAHGPKIFWQGEEDAADYLSLISLLHRKLDDCVPTNPHKKTS